MVLKGAEEFDAAIAKEGVCVVDFCRWTSVTLLTWTTLFVVDSNFKLRHRVGVLLPRVA